MRSNLIILRVHAVASIIGFVVILIFWTSTLWVELYGTHEKIAIVKQSIVLGMIILIPTMATIGGSGFKLMGKRRDPLILAKKRRMMIIGPIGILILVPAAFYLNFLASQGLFGASFQTVQAIEIVAGAVNLTLMGLNMRDGLRASGRIL